MSPKKLRRMDGYIRVSRVGKRDVEAESYQTEAIQREKIETWAKLRGIEIAAWHIDRDQSGSKLSRPGFDACMARIKDGKTDGIVVAQIDRLSRADVADALMIVRQIHDEYGGAMAAVDLGVDPTTEVGEMLLTVLLALARMQWRRYKSAWLAAKSRAIQRGAYVGPTPLGYNRVEGRLVPNEKALAVRAAYQIAATKGLSACMDFLRKNFPERTWTTPATRRWLGYRSYLGESRLAEQVNTHAHEPLIDLATWTAANKNAGGTTHAVKADYPLSEVVLCEACESGMVGTRVGRNQRAYRCKLNTRKRDERTCPHPAMAMAGPLEQYVRAALVAYTAKHRPDDEAVLVEGGDQKDVERAEAALRSAELSRTLDLQDLKLREMLGDEQFYERMEAHNAAVEEAQRVYEEAVENAQPELTWPLVDEIVASPDDALPELLERAGVVVSIAPGRGNLADRVSLVPAAVEQARDAA